ncbi:protein FAR1-RELATED SEQUENCE 6-like [Arachis ipaensis]|uniref:protein FAR1-RELATED SEQUENCE 6-like n=1 Tax=Arachis ipaensis TaxID=130454 RepID=UPI000A2B7DA2|nr:protein FAR1-RELATED SEQUENCE 6-like [Arachis ipaensis]XP_025665278.1 protein FAR1-RELATED SEQUENCE 6-like [Arachis hypogaea]
MTGAIRKVLPDTVHRWCIWHILKKSQFKFGGYARYRELNNKMNHIMYNSPSADSFEVDWTEFIKEFDLGQNRWLTDLYANRRKWVSIFFKSEFCAEVDRVPSCYVLPRWSKNIMHKHTYIKSSHDVARTDEGHNLFRRLCLEFYNVAQEFITCDEEAAILRSALWDAKTKLTDYCTRMHLTTVAAT